MSEGFKFILVLDYLWMLYNLIFLHCSRVPFFNQNYQFLAINASKNTADYTGHLPTKVLWLFVQA